jgi:DNA-binding response OmpR family regulator
VGISNALANGEDGVFSMIMAKDHRNQSGAGFLIFIVDDEPMLLDLAEMVLKSEGYEVRTFHDPATTVAEYAAAQPPPGLVLTDYAMDGMNGLDVIRECRKIHPDQKIILVSGTVDESVYANTEIKPDSFLSKPYDPNELLAAVRALAED